ncbi:Crp/Fnr family transcriptional regulator [Paracoccus aestuariivivens]|uniref:Cyclic nucleotide-binding domain-containing protein n=1 Tax=Paracoccus aestuariivivens TaxID=1820333 RepID=A0A6L6J894_9RHOB|nr:Crp/Fnr family transcriptional regulator [Paracoccus aestuariivivens]MTH76857.1 cyclic nucleotide-binding domain-containing protein [Paracoccus aestuariivivens]
MIGLQDLVWFSELPPAELNRIDSLSTRRTFTSGTRILERGDPGHTVLFVLSGQVLAVQWTQSGREIVYSDIGSGSAFGELSVISGHPRSLSLYARTDCTLLEMPGELFLGLIDAHPSVRAALMRGLVRRVYELTERVHELTSLGVEDRLRAYLLRVAMEQGGLEPGRTLTNLPTHAEIANIVGANREAVSRNFATLNRKGIIESGRKYLRILQPEALMHEGGQDQD